MDSADEEENDEQPTDENLVRIRDLLLASKAYASLKDRLLDFAHQPHRLRITKAVGGKAVGESGKELDPEALRIAIEEISWVPVHFSPPRSLARTVYRLWTV